jgi:hypothetical protein
MLLPGGRAYGKKVVISSTFSKKFPIRTPRRGGHGPNTIAVSRTDQTSESPRGPYFVPLLVAGEEHLNLGFEQYGNKHLQQQE